MKSGFLKSFAKSKKFRYSTMNIAFTAIVIVAVILFNAVFSLLADKNNWYFDMTEEQVFTLSDKAKSIISEASSDIELEIIFSSKKDLIENKRTTHQASMGFVVATAEQLASEFDNITVSYHDIARENKFFMELSKLAGPTVKLSEDSVIIARKNSDGRYSQVRAYSTNNFFATDEQGEIHAYGGELTFTSAVLSLTAEEQPTVYFTIGHEEVSFYKDLVTDEDGKVLDKVEVNYSNADVSFMTTTGAYREAIELMKVFTDAGYVVKPLDISKSGIPDDASIIVINAPALDFKQEELDLLKIYLLNSDEPGTLFCFLEKERQFIDENGNVTEDKNVFDNFRGLNSFIETRTGSKIVADNGYIQDSDASAADDFFAVDGEFPNNAAIGVYLPGREASVRFSETIYIEKLNNATHWDPASDENPDGGYAEGSFISYTMPLVVSSNKATVDKNGTPVKGPFNLMTMTAVNYWRQDTQDAITSYFLLSASNEVVSPDKLQDGAYVNRDLMYSIIRTTGGNQTGVPVGLGYKNFMDYNLNISTKQANRTTWCLALILPIAIATTGVIVVVKRKRR